MGIRDALRSIAQAVRGTPPDADPAGRAEHNLHTAASSAAAAAITTSEDGRTGSGAPWFIGSERDRAPSEDDAKADTVIRDHHELMAGSSDPDVRDYHVAELDGLFDDDAMHGPGLTEPPADHYGPDGQYLGDPPAAPEPSPAQTEAEALRDKYFHEMTIENTPLGFYDDRYEMDDFPEEFDPARSYVAEQTLLQHLREHPELRENPEWAAWYEGVDETAGDGPEAAEVAVAPDSPAGVPPSGGADRDHARADDGAPATETYHQVTTRSGDTVITRLGEDYARGAYGDFGPVREVRGSETAHGFAYHPADLGPDMRNTQETAASVESACTAVDELRNRRDEDSAPPASGDHGDEDRQIHTDC